MPSFVDPSEDGPSPDCYIQVIWDTSVEIADFQEAWRSSAAYRDDIGPKNYQAHQGSGAARSAKSPKLLGLCIPPDLPITSILQTSGPSSGGGQGATLFSTPARRRIVIVA